MSLASGRALLALANTLTAQQALIDSGVVTKEQCDQKEHNHSARASTENTMEDARSPHRLP